MNAPLLQHSGSRSECSFKQLSKGCNLEQKDCEEGQGASIGEAAPQVLCAGV